MSTDNKLNAICAIVLPCLNEEKYLAKTCKSLGFGTNKKNPSSTLLFIIDNGSHDASKAIAEVVKNNSKENTVLIFQCLQRGYVPARHFGNLMVLEWAKKNGYDPKTVLILQADADTIYSKSYANTILLNFKQCDTNTLFQARSEYPIIFKKKFSEFVKLAAKIDHSFNHLFLEEEYDCIIDDKAAGYSLDNYFKWGGHRVEYMLPDQELYVETTRLFIAARVFGVVKKVISEACVQHSPRNIIKNPVIYFATLGFPQSPLVDKFSFNISIKLSLQQVCKSIEQLENSNAVILRKLHIIGLFVILPLHIHNTLNTVVMNNNEFAQCVVTKLPFRTQADMRNNPGVFVKDIFDLIESHKDFLLQLIDSELERSR